MDGDTRLAPMMVWHWTPTYAVVILVDGKLQRELLVGVCGWRAAAPKSTMINAAETIEGVTAGVWQG
jgi:hypothetical protein